MRTQEQIDLEVNHIFESGANEIRVSELIKRITSQFQSQLSEKDQEIEGLHDKISEMNGHQELHYEELAAAKEVIEDYKKEIEQLKQWKKEQMLVWVNVDDFVRPMCSLGESVSNKTFDLLNEAIAEKQKSQRLYEATKVLNALIDAEWNKADRLRFKEHNVKKICNAQQQCLSAVNIYESTQPGDSGTKQDKI